MRNRIKNIDNVFYFSALHYKKRRRGKKKEDKYGLKKNVTDENVMKNLLVIEHV